MPKKNEKKQDGGFAAGLIFPMGKTLGYMTMSLIRVNEMFQESYRRKHGDYKFRPNQKKLKLKN